MILRIKHHKLNFTILTNEMLNDKTISFKARGLLSFLLSKPDNWMFYQKEIIKHSNHDKDTAIRSAVGELKQAGYLTCARQRDGKGKLKESEWEVSEIPHKKLNRGNPILGNPILGNPSLLRTDKRIRTESKKNVLQTSPSFDPEELPGHFIKHPKVIIAWLEFVQHRKETGHKLTPLAHKKITMEMLGHTPYEIIEAINTAITKGWRGLFYKNVGMVQNGAHLKGRVRGRPDTDASIILGVEGQMLYDFVAPILTGGASKTYMATIVDAMAEYHNTIPAKAAYHLGWDRFFKDWLKFLQEKQPRFPLQATNQLKIGGYRWNEFIQRCEHYTQYNFRTGEFQP